MRLFWDLDTVKHRQDVFSLALKKQFMTKIVKYQNILLRNGIQFHEDAADNVSAEQEAVLFQDDHVMVLSQNSFSLKRNLLKRFSRCGNTTSLRKVSHLIYTLILRRKAGRICAHLDGVTDVDVTACIEAVAREMAVAYEYQLMMLYTDREVVRLAEHAVACMLTYLEDKDAEFTCEALLTAVLEIKPKNSNKKEILQTRSLTHNGISFCPRWKVGRILKQPGLRVPVGNYAKKQAVESSAELSPVGHGLSADVDKEANMDETDAGLVSDSDLLSVAPAVGSETVEASDLTESTAVALQHAGGIQIGLENVSAALLGHLSGSGDRPVHLAPESCSSSLIKRKLSSVEMDFENNTLHIEEHACSVNVETFSPLNSISEGTENTKSVENEDHTDAEDELSVREDVADIGFDASEGVADAYQDSLGTEEKDVGTTDTLHEVVEEMVKANSNSVGEFPDYPKDKPDSVITEHETDQAENGELMNTLNASSKDTQSDTQTDTESSEEPAEPNSDDVAPNGYQFYGCFTPFGAKCQPKIYGFRGPLHVWNKDKAAFTLIYNDTVSTQSGNCREIVYKPKSPHMSYVPFTSCSHHIPIL